MAQSHTFAESIVRKKAYMKHVLCSLSSDLATVVSAVLSSSI